MAELLKDRVVLVTGASRGIGYHAALAIAKAGAHVIAVSRTVGGLEELDDEIQDAGGSATLVPLDLADMDAIDQLGASVFERWGKLDGLVGNAAALGVISPVGHISPEEWDKVMALNVTANYRLIRAFDPLLRRSDAGRAVFVSSPAAYHCRAFWGLYSTSKAALDALVRCYAAEMENTSVRANLVYPSAMRTTMRAKAMPGEDPDTLPHPRELAKGILQMLDPELRETGKIFDFTADGMLSFQKPV